MQLEDFDCIPFLDEVRCFVPGLHWGEVLEEFALDGCTQLLAVLIDGRTAPNNCSRCLRNPSPRVSHYPARMTTRVGALPVHLAHHYKSWRVGCPGFAPVTVLAF